MKSLKLAAAMMMAVAAMAQTGPADPVELSSEPRVVHAMVDAWLQTNCSMRDDEAGFSVNRDCASYSLVAQPPASKQNKRVGLSLTPGVTMAIFHVHPASADPRPSPADRRIADTYGVQVYVMHVSGLYVYDPVSRQTTRLRKATTWMKPQVTPLSASAL